MMREAQATLARGRSVVIFPEDTRVVPGERPPLRAGFAGLNSALCVEVLPISLNYGRLWPSQCAQHARALPFLFGAPFPTVPPPVQTEAPASSGKNPIVSLPQ